MKSVGEVVRVAQGLVVLRAPAESYPNPGSEVVTAELSTAGTVVDVFGPVDRPYLAVTPGESIHPPALLGDRLYAE